MTTETKTLPPDLARWREERAEALRQVALQRELDSLRDLRAMVLGAEAAGGAALLSQKALGWAWDNAVKVAKLSRGHFDASRPPAQAEEREPA